MLGERAAALRKAATLACRIVLFGALMLLAGRAFAAETFYASYLKQSGLWSQFEQFGLAIQQGKRPRM